MILALVLLISCDRLKGTRNTGGTSNITFNLSTPELKQTKATNVTRYIVEIYKASDLSTVVERVEQAGGTIMSLLENNTNYVCLFWADGVAPNDNANGIYNASNLKNITLNTGKQVGEAFFGRLDIIDNTTTFNITLKRPTAQVNIIATDVVLANTDLKVTFNQYNSFNTFASEVVGTAGSTSKTFNSTKTTGILGSFLTFASVVGIVSDFTAVYNSSVTNPIPSVPLKANYITNIRGKYGSGSQYFTLIIVIDDNWESVVDGVEINLGTSASPNWIKVADRNAEKGGTNGATAGNSATDYGYYYQWSNADNDPSNADKAHRACFDFAEGEGAWRLPTKAEWDVLAGNNGINHSDNANRKLQWDGSVWKLYDERPGQTANFVYFPIAGFLSSSYGLSGATYVGSYSYYWTSTSLFVDNKAGALGFYNNGYSLVSYDSSTKGYSVRCVRNM